jgi:hypothetical protein
MVLKNWDEIKNDFLDSDVFFGNGLSIYLYPSFNYKSLADFFLNNCSEKAKIIFQKYSTVNFETILKNIDLLIDKNKPLENDTTDYEVIKNEIKIGLIEAIEKTHPKPMFVDYPKIQQVAEFLYEMNNVYTINYDLLSYNIILENTEYGDYFFENHNYRFLKFNCIDKYRKKHIYYLHGSLFIFQKEEYTLKIKKATSHKYLLDVVDKYLLQNDYPLFISEGSYLDKKKAIENNSYLNFCFESFKNNNHENLVIFGCSFSDQDKHLIEIINKGYKNIAVSIYSYSNENELKNEMFRISQLFSNTNVFFFKSDSLFK